MKGQSIILLAVTLLGLVAVVAVAVDGWRLYAERAQMQTAADAGALAGTREMSGDICSSCGSKQAKTAADRFARLNGAEDVKVFIKGKTVEVTASVTVHPFFAGMLGFKEFTISADAAATCGRLVE